MTLIPSEINTELNNLQSSKAAIKNAIESKGVIVSSDIAFSDYPDKIREISGGVGIPREVSEQGVYRVPASTNFILPDNATTIAPYGLAYAFAYAGDKINSIDFNNISTINSHGCQNIAYSTGITTVNCESIVTIGENGLWCAFEQCSNMSGVINFANLTTIGSMGMYHAFQLDEHITGVNMPNLETIEYGGMQEAFRASSITTMTFSKLDNVGSSVFRYCFGNSTLSTISFPALKTTSFNGYTDQFDNMLYGIEGCTVHFPSNLQSVIGSWSDVTSGFGGTNTTVVYDLPATT